MSDIKINYGGIGEQINALNTKISEYSDLLQNASTIKQNVISSWEGKAAEAWNETVSGYIQKSQGLIDVLREFINYAQSVSSGFQSLDTECANLINNSF